MRIDLDQGEENANRITHYKKQQIKINDKIYQHNILLAPFEPVTHWSLSNIKDFSLADVEEILKLQPEVVIIGTGETLTHLKHTMTAKFITQGIGVEVMTTAAACRTYNVLMSEGRKVVAALII